MYTCASASVCTCACARAGAACVCGPYHKGSLSPEGRQSTLLSSRTVLIFSKNSNICSFSSSPPFKTIHDLCCRPKYLAMCECQREVRARACVRECCAHRHLRNAAATSPSIHTSRPSSETHFPMSSSTALPWRPIEMTWAPMLRWLASLVIISTVLSGSGDLRK